MSNNIKYANKFFDSPLTKGGIYGALSGVLGGGMGTILYNLLNKKKKNKWHKNVLKAMLIGGLTGTAAGIGGGAIYQHQKRKMIKDKVESVLKKPVVQKILGKLKGEDRSRVDNILKTVSETGDLNDKAIENIKTLINKEENKNQLNALIGAENFSKLKKVQTSADIENLAKKITKDKDVAIKFDENGKFIGVDQGQAFWNALKANGANIKKMTPGEIAADDLDRYIYGIKKEVPSIDKTLVVDPSNKEEIKKKIKYLSNELNNVWSLATKERSNLKPYASTRFFVEGFLKDDPVSTQIVEDELAENHYRSMAEQLSSEISSLKDLLNK